MFDAKAELAAIRARRKVMRRQRYRRSRLDDYRAEILQLRQQEPAATLSELALWLRQRRVKVAISTISRWLRLNTKEAPDA